MSDRAMNEEEKKPEKPEFKCSKCGKEDNEVPKEHRLKVHEKKMCFKCCGYGSSQDFILALDPDLQSRIIQVEGVVNAKIEHYQNLQIIRELKKLNNIKYIPYSQKLKKFNSQ